MQQNYIIPCHSVTDITLYYQNCVMDLNSIVPRITLHKRILLHYQNSIMLIELHHCYVIQLHYQSYIM